MQGRAAGIKLDTTRRIRVVPGPDPEANELHQLLIRLPVTLQYSIHGASKVGKACFGSVDVVPQ